MNAAASQREFHFAQHRRHRHREVFLARERQFLRREDVHQKRLMRIDTRPEHRRRHAGEKVIRRALENAIRIEQDGIDRRHGRYCARSLSKPSLLNEIGI
jgi:hypothetical protein